MQRLKRIRKRYNRIRRLMYPSPAELNFARILGARVYIFPWIRNRRGWPAAYILPAGSYKDNYLEREVGVAGYYIDFANRTLRRGIEVLGLEYHQDIVKEQDRRDHLAKRGWHIIFIRGDAVHPKSRYYRPDRVRDEVLNWLS